MIDACFATDMAHYNRWQNENLYAAADSLSEDARLQARGAFFGSIHDTLAHILWADRMWLSRLAGAPAPPRDTRRAGVLDIEWPAMRDGRAETDDALLHWARDLTPDVLAGTFRWTSGQSGEMARPTARVVAHVFNHQTHHRGQVHAMLTAAGAAPGVTDLAWMPDPD